MRTTRLAAVFLLLVFSLTMLAPPSAAAEPGGVVHIGMPASLFRDVKPAVFNALTRPFHSLVESQTGLKCELMLVRTPHEMCEQLEAGKLQFGVFHGFEFAWMKEKAPTLQAFMIAAPQHRPLRALLVVAEDSPFKSLADLKGQPVAMPQGTREFVRLFLNRQCQAAGQSPDAYFAQVTTPINSDTALHEVIDGKGVKAAVVDGGLFQGFAERYSGRAKRLRVLLSSENFPEGVVVIRPGVISEDTVARFRQGMATAHVTPLGRQLMALLGMAGFQPLPPNYEQQLIDVRRAYPPPTE